MLQHGAGVSDSSPAVDFVDFVDEPQSRAEQLAAQYHSSLPAWERDPYSERPERNDSDDSDEEFSEDFDWEYFGDEDRYLDSSPSPWVLDKIEKSDQRLAYLQKKGDHRGPEKARDQATKILQSIPIQEGKRGMIFLPNELAEKLVGDVRCDDSVDDGRFVYYSRQKAENQELKALANSQSGGGWGWEK